MPAGPAPRLTNLDRVLWPRTGFTKGDLLDYLRAAADAIVPHLAGRPLTLARYPAGVEEPGFAQMECRGAPPWLTVMPLEIRGGGTRTYCVVDDLRSLLWVGNLNAVELHPYPCRPGRPHEPAAAVFDLDPGAGTGPADACAVALRLRGVLAADHGLEALAKVSGVRGVHVLVPVAPGTTFERTRAFARATAERVAAERPDAITATTRPADRPGRVFVDWMQNAPRRSTVAPYSPRATPVPRISAPVTWDEVEAAAQEPERAPARLAFSPRDALDRIERHGDLLAPALRLEQVIP